MESTGLYRIRQLDMACLVPRPRPLRAQAALWSHAVVVVGRRYRTVTPHRAIGILGRVNAGETGSHAPRI